MAELYGVDFGVKQTCRMCQLDSFIVEIGTGKADDKPISVLTIRCSRCGTVLNQFTIDWKPLADECKVTVNK